MSDNNGTIATQLKFFTYDVGVLMNWRAHRWLTCWLRSQFWVTLSYRFGHALYLHCDRSWPAVELILRPLFAVMRPETVDINHRSVIGPGLFISHPALGVVISGHAVIGARTVLTGGNCIGIRRELEAEDQLLIGDDVYLGANAVILGPARVGNRVRIGAGVVVKGDVPDDVTVRTNWPADTPPHK